MIRSKSLTTADMVSAILQRNSWSLRALARRCGVSPATAQQWKNGHSIASDSHGLTLAALLNVDPAQVLLWLALERSDCPEGRAAWRQLSVAFFGQSPEVSGKSVGKE